MKVGDKVLIKGASYGQVDYKVTTITRETATQWITESGARWRKADSYLVGSSSKEGFHLSFFRLMELTPEAQSKYDAWVGEQQHKEIWRTITESLDRPKHVPVERLKEILAELRKTEETK